MNQETALIKMPSRPGEKFRVMMAGLTNKGDLNVGGQFNTAKRLVDVSVDGRQGQFIAKVDLSGAGPDFILGVVKANNLARINHLPVPYTTRFFYDENKNPGVLMTNVTENGQYWLWGRNMNISSQEREDLKSMQITAADFDNFIIDQIRQIAQRASESGLRIRFDSYHIRKHKKTRKLDITLLDLDASVYNHQIDQQTLNYQNKKSYQIFVKRLKEINGRVNSF